MNNHYTQIPDFFEKAGIRERGRDRFRFILWDGHPARPGSGYNFTQKSPHSSKFFLSLISLNLELREPPEKRWSVFCAEGFSPG